MTHLFGIYGRERDAAIARALELAAPVDVVLVAGKGHETTQEIAGRRSPFDDLAVARGLMESGAARPAGGARV